MVVLVLLTVVMLGVGGAVASNATDVRANRRVGPLFLDDSGRHTCTAGVVHSLHGDLMVTAAHCLTGVSGPITVAPGYDHGRSTFGVWSVREVYLDPEVSADPDGLDFAVLRIAPRDGRSLESVTGRGWTITPYRVGTRIRVVGYGAGEGDSPVGCRARTGTVKGVPTIRCSGLVDGTSGSPWLAAGRSMVGIVGGFRQGGCVSFISHSPLLLPRLAMLVARAEAGGPGDTPPTTSPSDC